MKFCEVCEEYGEKKKGPLYRIAETWLGQMGLYLCKRHALALTLRTLRREAPLRAPRMHVDPETRKTSFHSTN